MGETVTKVDILSNDFSQLTKDSKDRILKTAKKLYTIQMFGCDSVPPVPEKRKKPENRDEKEGQFDKTADKEADK